MSQELNPQMKKNLATFLSRVDIKGYEAEAMVELKIYFGLSPLKMVQPPPTSELPPGDKKDNK